MVAVAAGSVVAPRQLLRPFLLVGAVCAVLPDIDAIGRPFYGVTGDLEVFGGHRGFTHSITFAVLLGFFVSLTTLVDRRWRGHRTGCALFVAIVTALHGVLDVFTSIGATTSPVQFLSPFSTRGYAISRHPIDGPLSELFLCFIPLIALTRAVWHVRGIPWPRFETQRVVRLGLDTTGPPATPKPSSSDTSFGEGSDHRNR